MSGLVCGQLCAVVLRELASEGAGNTAAATLVYVQCEQKCENLCLYHSAPVAHQHKVALLPVRPMGAAATAHSPSYVLLCCVSLPVRALAVLPRLHE